MRLALTLALQEFSGALVVVSHDRYFLRNVSDDLWLVADGKAAVFEGDLEDYRLLRLSKNTNDDDKGVSVNTKKADRQVAAQQRQKLQPLRKQVQVAEKNMDKLHQHLQEVEMALADTELYEAVNKDRLKTLLQQQADYKAELAQTEVDWLDASEQLERAAQEVN